MKSRTVLLLLVLIGIHISLLLNTTFIDTPEMLLFPWFLKQGMTLYKDIIVVHSPGSVYLPYLFFSLTGFTEFWYRAFVYIFILSIDVLVYLAALSLFRKRNIAVLVTALYILFQVPLRGNSVWQEVMFTPFMIISYWVLNKYIQNQKVKYIYVVSVLFGLSLLIKQNALYPLIGSAIFIFILHIKKPFEGFKRSLILIFIPFIFVLLFVIIYSLNGLGHEFIFWVVQYPFLLIGKEHSYATFPKLMLALKVSAIYCAVPISFMLIFLTDMKKKEKQKISLLVLFCLSLVIGGLPRWEEFRMQPSLPFAILAIGFIINNFHSLQKKKILRYILILLGIPILIFSLQYVYRFYVIDNPHTYPFLIGKNNQVAKEMSRYIGNDSFYLLGNYEYFYFLMNKKPEVLPWTEHFPWLINEGDLDKKVLSQLKRDDITYIVLTKSEVPKKFVPFLDQYYQHVHTLSDGGWIVKKK